MEFGLDRINPILSKIGPGKSGSFGSEHSLQIFGQIGTFSFWSIPSDILTTGACPFISWAFGEPFRGAEL
jgi:hypothetical protein